MKLTVRVRAINKRITLITTAFVLAVSTLTASLPFILSQNASAVSGYSYGNVSLNGANWQVDRQAPSGGWNVDSANGRVLLFVNQTKSSPSSFNKTEGVMTSVPVGTTALSGSVYVSPDWSSKNSLRAGLWGVTNEPGASWPIVEYANIGGYTGWRAWDTGTGQWVALNISGAGNYKVEILIDQAQDKFRYFINNVEAGVSHTFSAGGKASFTNVILNSYNLGTGNTSDNYVVEWKNLKSGRTEAPVINSAPVYVGSSEPYDLATWTHSGANVKNFEYREYLSQAAAEADVNGDMNGDSAAYWRPLQGAASRAQTVGEAWTGEQKLYYRVVAIDVYNNRSLPSAVGTVIVDKNAPTVTLPADSGVVKDSLNLVGTVTDNSGISEYRYQILDENKNSLTGSLAQYGYSRAGGTSAVENGTLKTVDTSVLPSGAYTLRVWAFDNAGNRTGTKNAPHVTKFVVDRTNPVAGLSYSNNSQPTWNDVTVTLTTDEPSVAPSGWNFVTSTQFTKVFSSNEDGSVVAQDLVGNSATLQYSVTGIDKTVRGAIYPVSATTTTPLISGVLVYNVDENEPVSGVALDVYVNGARYQRTTDADGEWSIASAVLTDGANNLVSVYFAGADTDTAVALDSEIVATRVPVISAPLGAPVSGQPESQVNNQPNGGLPLTTFGAAQILGVGDTDDSGDTTGTPEVKGTSTEKTLAAAVGADNTNGSALGLAWYWWLLIVAALATLIWWITSAIRNRAQV